MLYFNCKFIKGISRTEKVTKISVFLADWQVLFREGIHFTLSGEEDIEVIGEAVENSEAMAFIEANLPSVAVLNLDHGEVTGIDVARRVRDNMFGVSVILVMDNEDEEQLFLALKSGASACLTKDADPEDVVIAIRKVVERLHPISHALLTPAIASRIIAELEGFAAMGEQLTEFMARLTSQEVEILRQIAAGSSSQQVEEALGIDDVELSQQLGYIQDKLVTNDHRRELIEVVQRGFPAMFPGAGLMGRPGVEYVTREEFEDFKEGLKEHFRTFFSGIR